MDRESSPETAGSADALQPTAVEAAGDHDAYRERIANATVSGPEQREDSSCEQSTPRIAVPDEDIVSEIPHGSSEAQGLWPGWEAFKLRQPGPLPAQIQRVYVLSLLVAGLGALSVLIGWINGSSSLDDGILPHVFFGALVWSAAQVRLGRIWARTLSAAIGAFLISTLVFIPVVGAFGVIATLVGSSGLSGGAGDLLSMLLVFVFGLAFVVLLARAIRGMYEKPTAEYLLKRSFGSPQSREWAVYTARWGPDAQRLTTTRSTFWWSFLFGPFGLVSAVRGARRAEARGEIAGPYISAWFSGWLIGAVTAVLGWVCLVIIIAGSR